MENITKENPFKNYIDLAAERLGGKVLYTTDDFFAEKENLIKKGRGVFIPDKYTENGKWMDGWESRRKRIAGHDWCIIQLAVSGKIKGFDIDTNHFLGNHPPFASVDGVLLNEEPSEEDLENDNFAWEEILSKSPLDPGSQHFFGIENEGVFTHLKLHIYPDGGVARFRVFGEVEKDWSVEQGNLLDLASALNGAKALVCNDMFFSDKNNLLLPNRGMNMGDGWETKRNRTPNNRDWVIIKLAHPGQIQKVLLDTCHFKGNYPHSFSLEACVCNSNVEDERIKWEELLPKKELSGHAEHFYTDEIVNDATFTHIRLNIFPDGGVSRLRLFGIINPLS